jgi:translation initiation factor IF-3
MSLEEAVNSAKNRKFDLSIVNDKIQPAVLKLIDYKKTIYDEFINNYLQKDQLDKLINPDKKIKTVTLKPKMGLTDLQFKVFF